MENYEEKYKAALKRAKTILKLTDNPKEANGYVYTIFPELCESEDERIRKALIRNFTNQHSSNFPTADGFTREQILSWFEKQGKNKDQNDRIYIQKFNIGDTLYRQGWSDHTIEKIYNDGKFEPVYICKNEEGLESHISFSEQDEWNLKDRVQPQSKQEWSEEDERKIMWLVRLISTAGFRELDNDKMPCSRGELIDWLKSIGSNHWKPSEYDISLLEEIARNIRNDVRPFCSEVSALEDLIKNIKTL